MVIAASLQSMTEAIQAKPTVRVETEIVRHDHFADHLARALTHARGEHIAAPDSVLNLFGNGLIKSVAAVLEKLESVESKAV